MPAVGYQPPTRLFLDDNRCVVRFITEEGRTSKDFDFSRIPLERDMQVAFATAFERRTGPASGVKAIGSAYLCYYALRSFSAYLSAQPAPPRHPADLTRQHLDAYRDHHRELRELGERTEELKRTLHAVDGLTDEFVAALRNSASKPRPVKTHCSYTQSEFRRIMTAARTDARGIAGRVRANRELLERWRNDQIDQSNQPDLQLGELLDHVERVGDVPRRGTSSGYRPPIREARGRIFELMARMHLCWPDVTPFLVLLMGMTAQNGGTILDASALSHHPNGDAAGTTTAIVDLLKPRRGARAHMPVVLADLPDWLTADDGSADKVTAHDELHTPLGVFLLLRELTEPARRNLGSDRLVVTWGPMGYRVGCGRPDQESLGAALRSWGQRLGLRTDSPASTSESAPLSLTLPRLRLSALEHRQQSVAHTDQVLANEYLGRDRGNIAAYQQVVARVLDDQVSRAKATALMPIISDADLAEAQQRPQQVAARFGLDAPTLKRMLAGELDTVLGACADNLASPYGTHGQPCRASFMRCLDCPCARATPQHLPIQTVVLEEFNRLRGELPPAQWARRFGLPHAQLTHLIDQHSDSAVAAARAAITDEDRRLVERFLTGELDHT